MDVCRASQKLPVWIIEHVWAHKMMDIQEVVDPSNWPDVDSQPLSLQDSWRLRVASAQVFSIVKTRDMEHFERVMDFLQATYQLQPRLVAAIKHMKIVFGLKTMVIMWMLKEGRGMIDTVSKIVQFFPSKLPQYQDQCSQREMFLMRKNHVDFKGLAQALAIDKDKFKGYIKNQMEEQYGERYGQKVEERLLHYLCELETVLPGDTHIDKILKKQSPVTEEEKLLLEVITSDSTTIATTLKKLLHCDVASCRPAEISQSPQVGKKDVEISQLPNSAPCGGSSKLLKSVEGETLPEIFRGEEAFGQNVSEESPLLLENRSDSDVGGHQQSEGDGELVKTKASQRSSECVQEAACWPQFCSRHRRWVKSILRECPDECSEELLLQANVSSSPLLFLSSSSTSSSQDLTPSNLVPGPPDQPPPQTSTRLQTAARGSEPTNPEDELSSGSSGSTSDASQTERLCRLRSTKETPLPALLSPVVRLVDIASFSGSYPIFEPHQASPRCFTISSNKHAVSASSPRNSPSSTSQSKDLSSVSTANQIPSSAKSSQQVVHQNSFKTRRQTRKASSLQSKPVRPAATSSSRSDRPATRSQTSRARLTISLQSQAVLLQSKLLRPYVSLSRLSAEECYRVTKGRNSTGTEEPAAQGSDDEDMREEDEEEDADSSFDPNALYTSNSSSSDGEDSLPCDPEYKPCIKKKTLLLEYESARVLNPV
ncbi:serine-rich adhesin for platelets [Embiotoca jacksoni]|uniref:serine-rich adhesin for platelets n=1 Tax=Embiotoca jacksoni TaxID=100190 RepID=UPI003704C1EE